MSPNPKTLLVDSIILRGVADVRLCVTLTKRGFMEFCGNQWNEDWRWKRTELERLSEETLNKVYEDPSVLLGPCPATDHYIPKYESFEDVHLRVEEAITVPIRRVPKAFAFSENDPPFHVFACSWYHLHNWGPLTETKFKADLADGVKQFARGLNAEGEFRAYPMTHKPPTTQGVAYWDWCGGAYPFDLRAVVSFDSTIMVDENGQEVERYSEDALVEAGFRFNLVTLTGKEGWQYGA